MRRALRREERHDCTAATAQGAAAGNGGGGGNGPAWTKRILCGTTGAAAPPNALGAAKGGAWKAGMAEGKAGLGAGPGADAMVGAGPGAGAMYGATGAAVAATAAAEAADSRCLRFRLISAARVGQANTLTLDFLQLYLNDLMDALCGQGCSQKYRNPNLGFCLKINRAPLTSCFLTLFSYGCRFTNVPSFFASTSDFFCAYRILCEPKQTSKMNAWQSNQ